MTCQCDVCVTFKRWRDVLLGDAPQDLKENTLNEIIERIIDVETDLEWNRAVFNGTWPGAQDILEKRLQRIKDAASLSVETKPTDPPEQA